MLTKTGEIATRTTVKLISIGILGTTILPCDAFWLCGVVLGVFDVAGVTFEEFVKIAASGEFGARPRSSANIKIVYHVVLLVSVYSNYRLYRNSALVVDDM